MFDSDQRGDHGRCWRYAVACVTIGIGRGQVLAERERYAGPDGTVVGTPITSSTMTELADEWSVQGLAACDAMVARHAIRPTLTS